MTRRVVENPPPLPGGVQDGDLLVGSGGFWVRLAKGAVGHVLKAGATVLSWGQVAFAELTGSLGAGQHGTLSDGDHTGPISGNARVTVRRNTGADVGTRRRINFIEGANVSLTVSDDAANEEVDVTIAAAAGGGGDHNLLSATHLDTTSGSVAAGDIIVGDSTPRWVRLARGTAGHVLKAGATLVSWGQVAFSELTGQLTTAQITDNAVTDAKLRDSAALSVIGRSANSLGDPADITAATDGHVLRRSGTTLGFGTVATGGITDGAVTGPKLATGPRTRSIVLVVPGNPAVGAIQSVRIIVPQAGTITAIRSTCRVAVTSGTYTYDVNRNGTTLYTTQANRPTRVSGDGIGAKTHTLPDVTSLAAGDVLDIDVDAVGAGISDITFHVEYTVS